MLSLHALSLYASTTEALTKTRFHALCDRIADAPAVAVEGGGVNFLEAKICLQWSCSGLDTKTSSKVLALGLGSLGALGMLACWCSWPEVLTLTLPDQEVSV